VALSSIMEGRGGGGGVPSRSDTQQGRPAPGGGGGKRERPKGLVSFFVAVLGVSGTPVKRVAPGEGRGGSCQNSSRRQGREGSTRSVMAIVEGNSRRGGHDKHCMKDNR